METDRAGGHAFDNVAFTLLPELTELGAEFYTRITSIPAFFSARKSGWGIS